MNIYNIADKFAPCKLFIKKLILFKTKNTSTLYIFI